MMFHCLYRGSLFKYDDDIAYWNFLAAGNYAARFYKYAMQSVFQLQEDLHAQMLTNVKAFEKSILKQLGGATGHDDYTGSEFAFQFSSFSQQQADLMLNAWKKLLPELITKYVYDCSLIDERLSNYYNCFAGTTMA